ncbi:DUF1850 domain-containing protein [Paenalcaligenes hermetiae]|uniref:DUF1850 domain-containing protein n=1 Tax=Paenalcaligenes hermetiae TaxID=1157987 RepID=A0ABP9LZ16_9BURK
MQLGVCLQLAAALHIPPVFIPSADFVLSWTHSIEKQRWEEHYRVEYDADQKQPVLKALKTRIRGSAAGMEPPEQSYWEQGWYVYQPLAPTPQTLPLMRSEFTPDYEWCDSSGCLPLSAYMPRDGGVTLLSPCIKAIEHNQ